MTDEKLPDSAKERQAKRRKKMEEDGYKTLSLGFVKAQYHPALKKLAKDIEIGGISEDLKIKTVIDNSESKKLKEELLKRNYLITDLKSQIVRLRKENTELALKSESKVSFFEKEFNSFKKLFWCIYFKK
jgi:hypothetical protein